MDVGLGVRYPTMRVLGNQTPFKIYYMGHKAPLLGYDFRKAWRVHEPNKSALTMLPPMLGGFLLTVQVITVL